MRILPAPLNEIIVRGFKFIRRQGDFQMYCIESDESVKYSFSYFFFISFLPNKTDSEGQNPLNDIYR